jgi:hypothetical protein
LATVFATFTSTIWYFKVNKARKDNYAAFYQVICAAVFILWYGKSQQGQEN